jgi:hypothetical protein
LTIPKWYIVAKNEYRIHTSRIRKIRPYFVFLVVGILALHVTFIAPAFVSLFVDDFVAILLSQTAIAMVQLLLFTVFFYFMIIPITNTLREDQTGALEIFLAAPIEPGDVLLGEFLGLMPFNAIFVAVVAGVFTALLQPLGLSFLQVAIIVIIFAITFFAASWLGIVIAAVLRVKLEQTARGRDIGRALAMIIALPMVALIYGLQFGGVLEALIDPNTPRIVKTLLGILPSSWGADVILAFIAHPGDLMSVGLLTVTRFGGLLVFFVAVLWGGSKVADRAYSLEPITFSSSRVHPNGVFYRSVRKIGGGASFGDLLVTIFKDYSRRLENLSMVIYMVGVLLLMSVFILPETASSEVPVASMLVQFIFPIVIVMVTGEVTVAGKERLCLFKQAPAGLTRLVKAMLLKSWVIVIPIAAGVTLLLSLLSPIAPLVMLLLDSLFMLVFVAGYAMFVLGLFLLNPVFTEKSPRLAMNIMIAIFGAIGLWAISLLALSPEFVESSPWGMLYLQLLQLPLAWLIGAVVLYLGTRRLSRIE